MPADRNKTLLRAMQFGAWVRTKQPPFRAVKWIPETRPDGRQSHRGRRWEEILPVGSTEAPRSFYAEDVTTAGPMEWLDYAPSRNAPICGYLVSRNPQPQYCARAVTPGRTWCRAHTAQFAQESGEEIDE